MRHSDKVKSLFSEASRARAAERGRAPVAAVTTILIDPAAWHHIIGQRIGLLSRLKGAPIRVSTRDHQDGITGKRLRHTRSPHAAIEDGTAAVAGRTARLDVAASKSDHSPNDLGNRLNQ